MNTRKLLTQLCGAIAASLLMPSLAGAVTVSVKNPEQYQGYVTASMPANLRPQMTLTREAGDGTGPLNVAITITDGSGYNLYYKITGYISKPTTIPMAAGVNSVNLDFEYITPSTSFDPGTVTLQVTAGGSSGVIIFHKRKFSVFAHTSGTHIGRTAKAAGAVVTFRLKRSEVISSVGTIPVIYTYSINGGAPTSGSVNAGTGATTDFSVTIPAGTPNGYMVLELTPGANYARALVLAVGGDPEIPAAPYREIVVIGTPETDWDGDGALDYDEVAINNTVADKYSTDGDILSDAFEVQAGGAAGGFDPLVATTVTPAQLDADTDGDGLKLIDEMRYQTNPNNPNTDGDAVNDGTEVARGTDPTDAADVSATPLTAAQVATTSLEVGDHSSSASERYVLRVGKIHHQAISFGGMSGPVSYKFRNGIQYPIRLIHVAGPGTDYDWTADMMRTSAGTLSGDFRDIFTVKGAANDGDSPNTIFGAAGKVGYYTAGTAAPGTVLGNLQISAINTEQCSGDYSQGGQTSSPDDDQKLHIFIRRPLGEITANPHTVFLKFDGTANWAGSYPKYKIESPSGITIPASGIISVTIPAGSDVLDLRFRLNNETFDPAGARWPAPPQPYSLTCALSEQSGGTPIGTITALLHSRKVSIARQSATVNPGLLANFRLRRAADGTYPVGTHPAMTAYYTYSINGSAWAAPVAVNYAANQIIADFPIAAPSQPSTGIIRVRTVTSEIDYCRAIESFYNSVHGGYTESPKDATEVVTWIGAANLDSDGDGLTDDAEVMTWGTNPDYFDTDGDLLSDGWEAQYSPTVNPRIQNNLDSDTDGDGLNLFAEATYSGDPGDSDTDNDTVNDGVEVAQGSDPADGSESTPPPSFELVTVSLTVGDPSGSESERYVLKVGNINHQSRDFGDVYTAEYKLRRGKQYNFSLKHAGTDPEANLPDPDLDRTASIGLSVPAEITDADPPILGTYADADPFPTGSGTLFIPYDESYYHIYLVPETVYANGKGSAQAIVDPPTSGVSWSIVEQGDDALGCTIDGGGHITCNGFRAGTVTVRATIGSVQKDAALNVICDVSCDSGDCSEGGGSAHNGSVDFSIALGRADYGNAPVGLRVKETQAANAILPSALKVTASSPQVEVYPPTGEISQVRTPSIVAAVADVTGTGYKVKLYYTSLLPTTALPLDLSSATPFATWEIASGTSGPMGSSVLITETIGTTLAHKHLYEYLGLNGTTYNWNLKTEWTGTDEIYKREERKVRTGNTEVFTISDISSTPIVLHQETRTYSAVFPIGEVLTEAIGSAGWNTTTKTYYDNGAPLGSPGRLATVQGPTGWERYYYDQYGRPTRTVTQLGDNAMPAQGNTALENQNRVKTINYLRISGLSVEETIVTVYSTTLVQPVEVSHTYKRFSKETIGLTTYDVVERIECQNRGVTTIGAVGNLNTKTYIFPAGHTFAFQPFKVVNPDGTMILYDYFEDTGTKTLQTTTWEGDASSDLTAVVDGLRTVQTVDRVGNLRNLRIYDLLAGATPVSETATVTGFFDAMGRATKYTFEDGTFSLMSYGCCGLESLTDRAGATTTYVYDAAKRVEREIGPEMGIYRAHDAAGRIKFVERFQWNNPGYNTRLEEYEYDDGDRIVSLTKPLGGNPGVSTATTLHGVSTDGSGHRVVTTTYANASTKREVYALNGRLIRIDGTAAHPVEYEYGADNDGEFTKEIRIRGPVGSESKAEWIKTSYDMLKRPSKTSYPSYNGNPAPSSVTTYSATTGQLISSTDLDGVVTLFEYNGKGETSRTAVDINRNGAIEVDIDRVEEIDTSWTTTTPPGGSAIMVQQSVESEWSLGSVTVLNNSFEAAVLGNGNTTSTVLNWTSTGTKGVIDPSTSHYPQAVLDAMDGENCAFIGSGSASGSIWQGSLGTIVANRQYRLNLKIGRRSGNNDNPTINVRLKYNNNASILAATTLTLNTIPAGSFQAVEVVYLVAAGNLAIGQTLSVEILSTGNGRVDIDNVKLTTADRTTRGTSLASVSGAFSSITEFGQTETLQTVYTPASFKRTDTVQKPDGSKGIREFIKGRLRYLTIQTSGGTQLAKTEYLYDTYGRAFQVSETRDGTTKSTQYSYYADDRLANQYGAIPDLGNTARPQSQYLYYDIDPAGPIMRITMPDGSVVSNKFYLTGEWRATYGSQNTPSEQTYDEQGRLKTITTWRDLSTPAAQAATAEVTAFTYDPARGFMTGKTINGAAGPTYDYFSSGRLKSRTWARGVTTTYAYNEAGDLKSVDYSDVAGGPEMTYTYNSRGEVQTVTDPTGTHSYTYRPDGKAQQELHTGGVLAGLSMNWGYDSVNRQQSMTAQAGATPLFSTSVGYKAGCSQLDYVSYNNNYVTYDYAAGTALPTTISHRQGSPTATPLFTTSQRHDALNRLRIVTHSVPQLPAYDVGYNIIDQKTSVVLNEGTKWNYTYDNRGQLQTAKRNWTDTLPNPAVLGQQFEYYYDQAGNRTYTTRDGKDGAVRQANYTANNFNRYTGRDVLGFVNVIGSANPLATVTANDEPTERRNSYFRAEVPVTAPSDSTVTVRGVRFDSSATPAPGRDRMTETSSTINVPPAAQSFSYDLDGNLLSDGVWTYTWDGENQLKSMERLNKTRMTFSYDFMGRRVKKGVETWSGGAYGAPVVTRFLYDGWHLVSELAATDTLIRGYVWGLTQRGSLDEANGVGALVMVWNQASSSLHYVTQDPFGNVSSLVNAVGGAVEATFEYSPFGELLQATGTAVNSCPIRFSNRYWENESGLVYYGLRYYSPSLGRWLNPDPIGELGGENLYHFVYNAPTMFVDPTGLYTFAETMDITGQFFSGLGSGALNVGKAIKGMTYDAVAGLARLAGTASTPEGREQLADAVKNAGRIAKLFFTNKCVRETLLKEFGDEIKDILTDPDKLSRALAEVGVAAATAGLGAVAEGAGQAGRIGKLLEALDKMIPDGLRAFKGGGRFGEGSHIPHGCFVAGTLVATEHGLREIQNIEAGEQVWSYDDQSSSWELKTVEAVFAREYDGDLVTLSAGGTVIVATGNHPIWVLEGGNLATRPPPAEVGPEERSLTASGRWVEARHLQRGDVLQLRNGSSVPVSQVRTETGRIMVYNIRVADNHTYAVSPEGILVHNANCGQLPGRSGAFNEAKRDLGIPRAQQPDSVRHLPMTDRNGNWIKGPNGKPIQTREYTYTRQNPVTKKPEQVIIQDHSAGHQYPNGVGNQPPHFNVRPVDKPRTGSVPGTQEHYPFKK